jgi:glutamate 5-kinase
MMSIVAGGEADAESERLIERAKRITIKIGSSLLIDAAGRRVREEWLATLAADVADLHKRGKQTVLVSSGAVALGREHLGLKRSPRLDLKQAAAAAGQPLLMQAWERAFAQFGMPTAQLLLTLEETESRRRWLNARATLEVLLAQNAIPIINENDSVATEELRYGDNDRLSARAAQMVRSDLLVLLSDVDGVYTGDPARDPGARHIPRIGIITSEIEAFAGGSLSGGVGTGGMRTKIAAAQIAQTFGCATIITAGGHLHPLKRLAQGGTATVIEAVGSPASAYKQWIAGTLHPAGAVRLDEGAVLALRSGKSLLPAGIVAVDGEFERGVCLRILDGAGREVARGLTGYNSSESRALAGSSSAAIEERLGWRGPDELIHRNDMVLL